MMMMFAMVMDTDDETVDDDEHRFDEIVGDDGQWVLLLQLQLLLRLQGWLRKLLMMVMWATLSGTLL